MKRESLVIITLISVLTLFLVYNFTPLLITGFGTLNRISVSVEEDVDVRMTVSFRPSVILGETQNIFTELTNTGTNPLTTTKMEQKIYIYEENKLNLSAYYYDISVPLNPGLRKEFETVFVPSETGTYYIKSIANYDNRKTKIWNVFFVYTPSAPSPPPAPTPSPAPAPTPGPAPEPEKIAEINLTYPSNASMFRNDSKLIEIKASNAGNIPLHDLKVQMSTPNNITAEINPKIVSELGVGESTIFLISIDAPENASKSNYTLDFEVLSEETKAEGSIKLEVLIMPASIREKIYGKLLNYEYLISEVDRDILSSHLGGYNVEMANKSLNKAKEGLEEAKSYYEAGEYEQARDKLTEVRKNLENAIFQLAHAKLRIVVEPAFAPPWILAMIMVLIVILAIFLIFSYKREKERKPKLLRGATENEM